jgi:hypothetical protein
VHIFTHKTYCYHFEEGWMDGRKLLHRRDDAL